MSADLRLAVLAALFAPGRAPSLLARAPGAAGSVERVARLAAAPRRERLRAFAAAFAAPGRPAPDAAARGERPRVAAVVAEIASGAAVPGVSRALARLCRERLAG